MVTIGNRRISALHLMTEVKFHASHQISGLQWFLNENMTIYEKIINKD